ncbi:CoA transferase [Polaromonas sp.]|uniref:CaiB/BaiF CoA transferase family protein n=1 Tax=Polaromonas sp. TaxID=1869339 RepID=UPI0025CC75CA|nr:CoA transferase [Polaromonas sp.]
MGQAGMVLSGIRVIDLGSYITAPYAAMLLAELGADVLKVEQPDGGDPFRSFSGEGMAPHFVSFNRNKESAAIDIRKPQGAEVLKLLLKDADVLLMNLRPGAEARLGLDFETLHALNPRLIWCAITGFGADGPYAERAAFDTVGLALSGLMHRVHRGEDPRIGGPALSDSMTGVFSALGIAGALLERARTGVGRKVEVSMLEATMAISVDGVLHPALVGSEPDFFIRGAASQAYVLTCSDGLRVGVHLSSPEKFWQGLLLAIDRPDLARKFPKRRDRVEGYKELAEELRVAFAAQSRAYWIDRLEQHDVPFAPENTQSDLPHDPQIKHLRVFDQTGKSGMSSDVPTASVNRAVRYNGDNRSSRFPPPLLGEHTEKHLLKAGLTADRIAELFKEGTVGLGLKRPDLQA